MEWLEIERETAAARPLNNQRGNAWKLETIRAALLSIKVILVGLGTRFELNMEAYGAYRSRCLETNFAIICERR